MNFCLRGILMVGMMALTAETLLVMAWQGIGNGLPLAAVVTTPEIAAVMAQRLHFNTYGGNPMCSAAGHAVLKVLDSEQRQQHCASVGNHLLHRLRALQDKHACIFAFLSLTFNVLEILSQSYIHHFLLIAVEILQGCWLQGRDLCICLSSSVWIVFRGD